jgi:hypothetical protein
MVLLSAALRGEGRRRVIQVARDKDCTPADGSPLPAHVAAGQRLGFSWPGDVPEQGSLSTTFEITYGYTRDPNSMAFSRQVGPSSVKWVGST